MQKKRSMLWFSLVAVILLTLAGCAPRPGAGDTAAAAPADAVVVDLPALALDVAPDGSLSMGGVPLADLGAALGAPLDGVSLPADTVAQLSRAGVQHIQIVNAPNGLMIFLNGQAIPSIGWTADLLANAAGLAPIPALAKVLPILTQLGVGATLRLPLQEGATPIPLLASDTDSSATRLAQAQEAFISSVGRAPQVTIPVYYETDGTWTVAGLSGEEWQAVTGMDFWKMLNLRERDINGALGLGIKDFELSVDPDGVHFAVNDTELPYVDWSEGKLASVIDVAEQAGMLSDLGVAPEGLTMLLDTFLPIVTSANVNIVAHFPAQ